MESQSEIGNFQLLQPCLITVTLPITYLVIGNATASLIYSVAW